MGNSLVLTDFRDCDGPGPSVEFFQSIRLKQLKHFMSKIEQKMLRDFDIDDFSETLSWREYFSLFSEIKEKMDEDSVSQQRLQWHSSCMGYEMQRKEDVFEVPPPEEVKGVADDYTDDDASEDGDADDETGTDNGGGGGDAEGGSNPSESQASESVSSKSSSSAVTNSTTTASVIVPRRVGWNPSVISPVFFGYSTYTTAERMQEVAESKAKTKIAEDRAVAKAKLSRHAILDGYEKAVQNQARIRELKIKELEAKYQTAQARRDENFKQNQRDLSAVAFKMFQVLLQMPFIDEQLFPFFHN